MTHSKAKKPVASKSEYPKLSVFQDLNKYMEASEDGKSTLPKKIQVLPIGTWDTEQYGPISITKEYLSMVVENFKRGLRKGLPIDKDHNRMEAMGWMDNPEIVEDGENPGLYCDTEWTPLGKDLLKGKIYRFFSPEWSDDYVDPETGIHHGPCLIAGTLTNRPLFKELTPLVASEGNLTNSGGAMLLLAQDNNPSIKHMQKELQDALSKQVSELTAEEKALIKAHEEELNDEQKETFGDVLGETEETEETQEQEETEEKEEETEDETKEEETKEEEVKEGSEKLVTVKASEMEKLQANAEAGRKAMEILETKEAEEKAQGFIMSENGKGRVLPKAKKNIVSLIRSFSESQMQDFEAVMESIPSAKMFSEIGKDEQGESANAKTAFEQKAKEIMEANEGMTLAQANIKVAEQHPELYKEYEKTLEHK